MALERKYFDLGYAWLVSPIDQMTDGEWICSLIIKKAIQNHLYLHSILEKVVRPGISWVNQTIVIKATTQFDTENSQFSPAVGNKQALLVHLILTALIHIPVYQIKNVMEKTHLHLIQPVWKWNPPELAQ